MKIFKRESKKRNAKCKCCGLGIWTINGEIVSYLEKGAKPLRINKNKKDLYCEYCKDPISLKDRQEIINNIKFALEKDQCYVKLSQIIKTCIHNESHWSEQIVKIKRIETYNSRYHLDSGAVEDWLGNNIIIVFDNKYYIPFTKNPDGTISGRLWHNDKEKRWFLFTCKCRCQIERMATKEEFTSQPTIPTQERAITIATFKPN